MPKNPSDTPGSVKDVMVPFDRVVGLVRHLTHDIRNGLNTLDLQTSFLMELVTDPETTPEVKRLRAMISTTAKTLQSFSATFWLSDAYPVTYSAKIFVEDLRTRLISVLPEGAAQMPWTETLAEESISVDIELIFRAFSEFFKNAFQFREKGQEISVRIFAEGGRFILELREGKTSVPSAPDTWGREPLVSTRRGGFGMGLFYARRILDVHDGVVDFTFDPADGLLTTRISLPLANG